MMACQKKKIVIVGGTGNLGRSVAISLNKNHHFEIFVTTRDSQSPIAQALSSIGINVVTANNWEGDALAEVMRECWGLFINIDSDNPDEQWKSGKQPTELDMGRTIIDSAIKRGVAHLVHASLPFASELTNGKMPMVSFDDKARVSRYMMEAAASNKIQTATIVNAGWFLENAFDPKYVESFGGFAKLVDDEGYLTWKTPPMGNDPESVPWLAVADDFGDLVHGVFLEPEIWNNQYIDGVSESVGFSELTRKFQKVTGKKARFVPVLAGDLTAGNATKAKEVNGLFDLMHALNGCFFNGKPTDHGNARILKRKACEATNRKESLMSVAQFFQKYA